MGIASARRALPELPCLALAVLAFGGAAPAGGGTQPTAAEAPAVPVAAVARLAGQVVDGALTRRPRGARAGVPHHRRRIRRRQSGRRHGRPRRTLFHRRPDARGVSRAGGSGRLPRGRDLTRDGARGGAGPARRRRGAIDLRPGGAFDERAGRGRARGAWRGGGRPGTRRPSVAPTAGSRSAVSATERTPSARSSGTRRRRRFTGSPPAATASRFRSPWSCGGARRLAGASCRTPAPASPDSRSVPSPPRWRPATTRCRWSREPTRAVGSRSVRSRPAATG